jgi:hypothetical protein
VRHDRNDFLLRKAQRFSDLPRLTVVVANYTFGFFFFYHPLHFEGEEVFGFAKKPTNFPFGVDNYFHCHDRVNFSRPRVTIPTAQPNVVGNVDMQQPPCGSNACLPLVFQSGSELKENICVDGKWWIKCCPLNSVV